MYFRKKQINLIVLLTTTSVLLASCAPPGKVQPPSAATQPSQPNVSVVEKPSTSESAAETEEQPLSEVAADHGRLVNKHAQAVAVIREKLQENGAEASRKETAISELDYDNRAFPADNIQSAQQAASYTAFQSVQRLPGGKRNNWQLVGPVNALVVGEATYTGRPTFASGRVTALAVDPRCRANELNDCKVLLGSAGGGIWKAGDAMATKLEWKQVNNGIPSNSIGSLYFDPNDRKGNVVYAGTGEPNGSSDSEAGIGLYKSTDFAKTWSVVPGSYAVAIDRSVSAIAVEPGNPNHIYIGTAVARHGSSSSNGGRFTPPNAPKVGLYESRDGGATFSLVFSVTTDPVNPTSVNGSDFFRGGVTKMEMAGTQVYFSVFSYGLYRSNGAGGFEQVFASAGGGAAAASLGSRTEFALAPMPSSLRIYLGDTNGGPANFYRVDNANVPATALSNGGVNAGWLKLSSNDQTTRGFDSYNFCGGQCSYDMVVASPKGQPDVVWLGGQMQYSEIFTARPPSNGRAVIRSTDAGASFTDMTNDTQNPPMGLHPDQHAIVFAGDPNIAFIGSDGGVVRTNGQFVDTSAQCATRGLTPTQLANCQAWLRAVPGQLYSLNEGLSSLQFQSVSVNPNNPRGDVLGGTQDNGTWAYSNKNDNPQDGRWFESVGGDGGVSAIDAVNGNVRVHTYFNAQLDVNFRTNDPLGWNWISDPLLASGEGQSFYVPIIADPKVGGTMFVGLEHVWRTLDNGGPQAFLEQHCNEFTGDFTVNCGDWLPLGGAAGNLIAGPATDKGTGYVVAVERAPSDTSTMWVGTRRGRIFISKNANAGDPATVSYLRLDTPTQPRRFVSGIIIDPANPNHAWVSFTGYEAYTPGQPGHVFEVTFDGATATWKDISYNVGDQPVTDIARDAGTGDLFIATDFGVAILANGASAWAPAAGNLPPVAVYGLTIDLKSRLLYAATHGRGIWRLDLSK